jgi:hypothetical protein
MCVCVNFVAMRKMGLCLNFLDISQFPHIIINKIVALAVSRNAMRLVYYTRQAIQLLPTMLRG